MGFADILDTTVSALGDSTANADGKILIVSSWRRSQAAGNTTLKGTH